MTGSATLLVSAVFNDILCDGGAVTMVMVSFASKYCTVCSHFSSFLRAAISLNYLVLYNPIIRFSTLFFLFRYYSEQASVAVPVAVQPPAAAAAGAVNSSSQSELVSVNSSQSAPPATVDSGRYQCPYSREDVSPDSTTVEGSVARYELEIHINFPIHQCC